MVWYPGVMWVGVHSLASNFNLPPSPFSFLFLCLSLPSSHPPLPSFLPSFLPPFLPPSLPPSFPLSPSLPPSLPL